MSFLELLWGLHNNLINKGVDSFKGVQKPVIDSLVKKYTSKIECARCNNGNISVLTDYIFIEENGLCPMCEYDREKFMKE